jgi:hypothetical protein
MTAPTLTAASVTPRSSDVVVKWTVVGDMPDHGTWLLSTTIFGGEKTPIYQLGVKALDARIIAAFIFDHAKRLQHNYTLNVSRTGDVWTAVFPASEIDVASTGRWKATLNLAGEDTDLVEGTLSRTP